MAKPGDLTKGMAEVLGVSEVNVRAHDRVLSEAGFRKKGGRGLSAAKMASEDAARLFIAIGSGGQAKDAATSVEKYSGLMSVFQRHAILYNRSMLTTFGYRDPVSSLGLNLSSVDNLPVNHTFFEILDLLILAAQTGDLQSAARERKSIDHPTGLRSVGTWEIKVRMSGPTPHAEVSIGCDEELVTAIYADRSGGEEKGDLRREFTITHRTILGLGDILRK